MYNTPRRLSNRTTLGIDERWERVICYAGIWVTGLIMLLVEHRNENVRQHAKQSVLVFGSLSVILWIVSFFGGALGWIPVIGLIFGAGFGLIHAAVFFIGFLLWIFFMLSALASARTHFVGTRTERMF